MKRNVGSIDRIIRIVIGLALIAIPVTGGTMWGYAGILPLVTGLVGWCPPYSLLGLSTCGKKGCCCR
jgi:hypothetical protein